MAFPFRSHTIGVLVEVVGRAYTNAQIGTLLLKAEADEWEPARADNKQHRLQRTFKEMRVEDTPEAERAARELVRLVLKKIRPTPIGRQPFLAEWSALRDALATDGWEFDIESGQLTPIVPEVEVPKELDGLEAELDQRGWPTARLHFRRAVNGYGNGDWESANSQLRTFLEDFLPSVAQEANGKRPRNPIAAIQALHQELVDEGERELLKGLWSLCNERGSHPGESNPIEATFRLMTVTSTARLLLSRLGPD